ncbi:MAG: hypothetical protein LBT05_00530 [Planctomycetaceae bacterium]|nr:hypothetical protein [Planctomycetaceae bacterium]
MLSLSMLVGCKMCANADIYGSPVAGSANDNYHRAGSVLGGYGGNYSDNFNGTAQAKQVYDSNISSWQQTAPSKTAPTLAPTPQPRRITTYGESSYVVPATPIPNQFSAQQLLQEQNGATDIRILSVQDSVVSNAN